MNLIDRFVGVFSPEAAFRRAQYRRLLGAYEAARPRRTRTNPADNRSGNAVTLGAAATLRGQARHLDQNHDLARGVLNVLVANIVGPKGIGIEPQPKTLSGEVHQEFAEELAWYYREWCRRPEVRREYSWAKAQRLLCRSWLRDGEVLAKELAGSYPRLNHRSKVPYSLELLEADYIADINDEAKNIVQGIERNAWGEARYYHLYEQHPGDVPWQTKARRVDAGIIHHLKQVDRIGQGRGVSIFAPVMDRLNDLKDYEESERVAARVAAVMAAYIKKGSPDMFVAPEDDSGNRLFEFAPGMVFDNLLPGEEVGTIESNRPSVLLEPFRNAMLKAISAGTSTGYSSISKSYDGTYSAQRQELVEQWAHYALLADEFISQMLMPIWETFVRTAVAYQIVKLPPDIDMDTLFDADYLPPAMPWIDPAKEAAGFEKLIQLRITSPQRIIRQRGDNPTDVLDQLEHWQRETERRRISAEQVQSEAPDSGASSFQESEK